MSELKVEKINLGTSLSSENPNAAIHITRDNNTSTIVIEENMVSSAGGDIRFWKTRDGAVTETNDYLGSIIFYSDKGETQTSQIAALTDESGNGSSKIRIRTKEAGDSSPTTRMTIKEDGKVGIGTVTPEGILSIDGQTTTGVPGLHLKGFTSSELDIAVEDGEDLQIGSWDSSGDTADLKMIIKDDGSVGIGDSNPDLRFVAKHSKGSGVDNVCFRMENTNSSNGSDVLMLKTGVTTASSTVSNMYIVFQSSDGRIGRIAADGSGGIALTDAFTGGHPTVIPTDTVGEPGMIVESTGQIWAKSHIDKGVSTGIPKVQLTTSTASKKVYGVVSEIYAEENEEYGYSGYVRNWGVTENETHIKVNSLGEGLIWVTNKNGEIQNGDFICSTDIPGHGGKQSDDLLHNYTVAKCVETIDWNTVSDTIDHNDETYKKYLVACTYHCG